MLCFKNVEKNRKNLENLTNLKIIEISLKIINAQEWEKKIFVQPLKNNLKKNPENLIF